MTGVSTAAALLGPPLAVAVTGLIALLLPGDVRINTLPVLLMFFPILIGVVSAIFLFAGGRRAWTLTGLANVIAWSLLYAWKAAGIATV